VRGSQLKTAQPQNQADSFLSSLDQTISQIHPQAHRLHPSLTTTRPLRMPKRKEALNDEGSDSNLPRQTLAKKRVLSLPSPPFKTCTIHRVHCSPTKDHIKHSTVAYFEDAPRLFAGDSKASALRGKHNIPDVTNFVQSHSHIGIILY
jgi:hypothetical protein